jgi:hypothetical protein
VISPVFLLIYPEKIRVAKTCVHMIFLTRQTFQDNYKEVLASLTLRLLTVISNTVLTSKVISNNNAPGISYFWQGCNNITPKVSGICP